jgi:hypothetical protein
MLLLLLLLLLRLPLPPKMGGLLRCEARAIAALQWRLRESRPHTVASDAELMLQLMMKVRCQCGRGHRRGQRNLASRHHLLHLFRPAHRPPRHCRRICLGRGYPHNRHRCNLRLRLALGATTCCRSAVRGTRMYTRRRRATALVATLRGSAQSVSPTGLLTAPFPLRRTSRRGHCAAASIFVALGAVRVIGTRHGGSRGEHLPPSAVDRKHGTLPDRNTPHHARLATHGRHEGVETNDMLHVRAVLASDPEECARGGVPRWGGA